jgi:hypothetical protein
VKWVTWENIGVDRMACIWLIRRFIDPEAELMFVHPKTQPLPPDGEPFDIPGVRLTHRRGHCTLHTMLEAYNLTDPILKRIACIVDEADVLQETTIEPAAPGLDLICRGIRLTCSDDYAAMERGAVVYEALYAQLTLDQSV